LEIEAEIYLPNPSSMITKNKGESGSPWRMPHEGEKGLEGTPLIGMEKNPEEISF